MSLQQVCLEIDVAESQRAAVQTLGDKRLEEALPGMAALALREWLDWLMADDRPASLTELAKRRVRSMVDEGLLPRIPTAPVVAQRTRLTLGQARYIVTALALEDPAASAEAREGLIQRLRDALGGAGVTDPDELTEDDISALALGESLVFDAPRYESDLAVATHEELLNERFSESQRLNIDDFEPPRARRRTDAYVQLIMRRHVAASVLKRLTRAEQR